MLVQSGSLQLERTRDHADHFVKEMRREIQRAATAGSDLPPRLRSIHERPGHATPEYRTLIIPVPPGLSALPPQVLRATIAHFAEQRKPDRLLLGLDVLREDENGTIHNVLIVEARDLVGTRLFWLQPYRLSGSTAEWDAPLDGGWQDAGDEVLILDAAFQASR